MWRAAREDLFAVTNEIFDRLTTPRVKSRELNDKRIGNYTVNTGVSRSNYATSRGTIAAS